MKLKRWGLLAGKLALVALVAWGVRRSLTAAWDELGRSEWKLHPGGAVVCGVFYLLALALCGWFWQRVLGAFGQHPRRRDALRAYLISHLGKYVPGKALVVVVRTALVSGRGVEPSVAAVSVFYETLTFFAVGAAWAVVFLLVWFPQATTLLWAALAVWAITQLPTVPALFTRLVYVAQLLRLPLNQGVSRQLPWRTVAEGWLILSLAWGCLALSLGAAVRAVGHGAPFTASDLPRLVIAVSLAMGLGFVSFIPAGAVVRELVLLELLAPRVGEANALLSAVLLRGVWLVSELIVSVILYFGVRSSAGVAQVTARDGTHGPPGDASV